MKFLTNLMTIIFYVCCLNANTFENLDKSAILMEFNITNNSANIKTLDNIIAEIDEKDRRLFRKIIAERPQNAYMILQELERKDAPEFLLYLAMIESHLTNSATSRASAGGMWQFMPTTAQNFGLKVTKEIDERRDPFQSTDAAFKYLQNMNNDFGKWYLSVMSYNVGGGAIKNITKKYGDEFCDILNNRKVPSETKNFIKQIIKLSVLAKTENIKEKLYEEAPNYHLEKVIVKGGTTLSEVGEAIGVDLENMKKYNAHIMADCAPKNLENYHFYIPADKLDMFVINYIQDDSKTLLSANLISQNEPQITKFEGKFRSKSDIIRAVYHS